MPTYTIITDTPMSATLSLCTVRVEFDGLEFVQDVVVPTDTKGAALQAYADDYATAFRALP